MQPLRRQTAPGASRAVQLWLATPEHGNDASRLARRARERAASRMLLAVAGAPDMPRRSLTHSGGTAAIAIVPAGSRAGVDMEAVVPRDVRSISQFAFSADEARELDSLTPHAATARFYLLWTLKEAFAKALAMPLLVALRDCSFTYSDGCWAGQIPTAEPWRATVFTPRPRLTLAAVIVGARESPFAGWACREWPGAAVPPWPCVATCAGGGLREVG